MEQPLTNLELTIEKLVYGGDGLGRADGRVVFTPFVLPGERVVVEPASVKGGLLRARLREVLTASEARVDPPCPYFGTCGGCHLQHSSYAEQIEAKRSILRETLRRVGKIEWPAEIAVIAGEPWGYRNRSQFHIAGTADGSAVGYLEAQSHRLCPIAQCPISSPRVNVALAALIDMTRDSRWPRFVRGVEVFATETETQLNVLESERPVAKRFFEWCAEAVPGFTPGPLDYPAGGFLYRVAGGSFFQVNRYLIEALAEAGIGGASGGRALDLYAGVGLFSLPLARRFAQVTAVESGASAVRDLKLNAERAQARLEIVQSAALEYLGKLETAPEFVLADPPRTGLGKGVVERLAQLKPRLLTIVACDPATLARDLAGLFAAGYEIRRLTMIDLFPQTFHIETIAELAI